MRRTALRWTASALAILLLLAALPVCIAVLIDGQHLRAPFVQFAAACLGRPLQVDGAIETHLLSMRPRVVAQHVTIGNPPWTPPGVTAEIGGLTLVLERWPVFGLEFEVRQLEVEDASLRLARDVVQWREWPGGEQCIACAPEHPRRALALREFL